MTDRSSKIFIYGVPGAGKTTLSWHIKQLLNLPLVEGDQLRGVAQIGHTREEAPFLWLGTTEAWRKFGEYSETAVMKGIGAIRDALASYVENELTLYSGPMILEAAFLDPARLASKGQLVLVVTPDEVRHREQYFQYRRMGIEKQSAFESVRLLQELLIKEASQYPVKIVENESDSQLLAKKLAQELSNEI